MTKNPSAQGTATHHGADDRLAGNGETASARDQVDVVVVGAGMAGLYALHKLREAGLRAVALEAEAGVGGTWYRNRYPGARCDVESMFYSFSFSPELEQEWEWTEKFATQPEILRYLEHVADRFDLRRDVRTSTRVDSLDFDEDHGRWLVRTDTGAELDAQFCIIATGCLSVPKMPEIPGLSSFRGLFHHTAQWPHDGVDFTGLRVGVVGTGSSGLQSIPLIAEQAAALTVFQRTPVYTTPALNRPLEAADVEPIKAAYDELRELTRTSPFGVPALPSTRSALEVDADERERVYEDAYQVGGLFAVPYSFADIQITQEANDTAAEFLRGKIRSLVADPVVAELLCPTDYPYACKRPCLDTGYYETFNRDNVELVDLRATPITRIVPAGVETTAGLHELDAIVYATGFDAITGALAAIDIRGRGGLALADKWATGWRSYLGLAVAGFPNLFTVTGPGSPSVISNMIVSIEQHVDWITNALTTARSEGNDVIEATEDAEHGWVKHVAEVGDLTLFPKAESWYVGANVPGKPRVLMPYVGGVGVYRQMCDEIAADGYRGFTMTAAPSGARTVAPAGR